MNDILQDAKKALKKVKNDRSIARAERYNLMKVLDSIAEEISRSPRPELKLLLRKKINDLDALTKHINDLNIAELDLLKLKYRG